MDVGMEAEESAYDTSNGLAFLRTSAFLIEFYVFFAMASTSGAEAATLYDCFNKCHKARRGQKIDRN